MTKVARFVRVFGHGSLERIELTIDAYGASIKGTYSWDCGTAQHTVDVEQGTTWEDGSTEQARNIWDSDDAEGLAQELLTEWCDNHQDPCLLDPACD